MQRSNATKPAPGVSGKRASKKTDRLGSAIGADVRRPHVIAQVTKSRTSRIRISLTRWAGVDFVEIRELAAAIPGCWQPTGVPVLVPLDKVTELIAALRAAEAAP